MTDTGQPKSASSSRHSSRSLSATTPLISPGDAASHGTSSASSSRSPAAPGCFAKLKRNFSTCYWCCRRRKTVAAMSIVSAISEVYSLYTDVVLCMALYTPPTRGQAPHDLRLFYVAVIFIVGPVVVPALFQTFVSFQVRKHDEERIIMDCQSGCCEYTSLEKGVSSAGCCLYAYFFCPCRSIDAPMLATCLESTADGNQRCRPGRRCALCCLPILPLLAPLVSLVLFVLLFPMRLLSHVVVALFEPYLRLQFAWDTWRGVRVVLHCIHSHTHTHTPCMLLSGPLSGPLSTVGAA